MGTELLALEAVDCAAKRWRARLLVYDEINPLHALTVDGWSPEIDPIPKQLLRAATRPA